MEETIYLSFEKLYFRTFEVGDGVLPIRGGWYTGVKYAIAVQEQFILRAHDWPFVRNTPSLELRI